MSPRTVIDGHLDVETNDGHAFRIHVIKGGKGLGIVPIQKRGAAKRKKGGAGGRAPGPGTVAVRKQMTADASSGALQASSVYADMLRSVEPSISQAGASQRVYRERRALLQATPGLKTKAAPKRTRSSTAKKAAARTGRKPAKAAGRPGRKPSETTLALREKMATDAERGQLKAAGVYADFLIKRGVKDSTARQTVYRERRAYQGARPVKKTKATKRKRTGVLGPLREKLRADADRGVLREARHYINWVLGQDKKMGLKQARTMVYRERRAVAG